jgi:rhomboid protease GluP
MIIGSFIEGMIGTFKTAILYFASSIGGCIFSCMITDNPGVGASVAIYGMLGAYVKLKLIQIGFTAMNWNALDRIQGPMTKYFNLLFIIFIIMLNISLGFTNSLIDNYGHLGGLIYGFFLIFVIHKPIDGDSDGMCCRYTIWFWISTITLTFLYLGLLILFYTVRIVKQV